jgi:hypothetical protein
MRHHHGQLFLLPLAGRISILIPSISQKCEWAQAEAVLDSQNETKDES